MKLKHLVSCTFCGVVMNVEVLKQRSLGDTVPCYVCGKPITIRKPKAVAVPFIGLTPTV